jgi:hypothetical protein
VAIAAASAFSVVTAASATAATWTQGPGEPRETQAQPARPGNQAVTHEARLTVTDQLALPMAETADQQSSATLVQHAYQIRLAATQDAIAQRKAAQQRAAAKKATATPTPAAAQPTQTATAPAASGSPQQIATALLGSFGWSASQFSCLDPLWAHESGWSVSAYNPGSGAFGIPQALPGSRMASAGPDWQTNAATQITWGLEYIKGTYGSPCAAWAHEQATGWY